MKFVTSLLLSAAAGRGLHQENGSGSTFSMGDSMGDDPRPMTDIEAYMEYVLYTCSIDDLT